jgi:hypothetical protein
MRGRRSRRSSTEFDTDGPPETCSAMVTQSGLSAPVARSSTLGARQKGGSAHVTRAAPEPAAQGLAADQPPLHRQPSRPVHTHRLQRPLSLRHPACFSMVARGRSAAALPSKCSGDALAAQGARLLGSVTLSPLDAGLAGLHGIRHRCLTPRTAAALHAAQRRPPSSSRSPRPIPLASAQCEVHRLV